MKDKEMNKDYITMNNGDFRVPQLAVIYSVRQKVFLG